MENSFICFDSFDDKNSFSNLFLELGLNNVIPYDFSSLHENNLLNSFHIENNSKANSFENKDSNNKRQSMNEDKNKIKQKKLFKIDVIEKKTLLSKISKSNDNKYICPFCDTNILR